MKETNILIMLGVFIFIFSILTLIRLVFTLLVKANKEEKLVLGLNEKIFFGLILSYFLTYIVWLIM